MLSEEKLQKCLNVEALRSLSLAGQHPHQEAEVIVVHEGVEVNEVFVPGTLG